MKIRARQEEGTWCWRDHDGEVGVCFAGRGPQPRPEVRQWIRPFVPAGVEAAWSKQVHSARVLDAVAGCAGEADALITTGGSLALVVVTADCVPVLLAGSAAEGSRQLAAVHAGWRGVASRIVPAALERLEGPGNELAAWIGPAIGRCCYEVGDDVAAQVVAGLAEAESGVVQPGARGRPHLDLRQAVESQLRENGVRRIRHVDRCTHCEDRLWSYRRQGPRAGRNLALIWLDPAGYST